MKTALILAFAAVVTASVSLAAVEVSRQFGGGIEIPDDLPPPPPLDMYEWGAEGNPPRDVNPHPHFEGNTINIMDELSPPMGPG